MSLSDHAIDALYQLPLAEFTAARNALAKTLSGEDAAHVRTLRKPVVVPWAVNQVFWHARPVYDRVLTLGQALRAAQLAALKGKPSDVRAAAEAHRKAVADAVRRAGELAGTHGAKPDAEPLTRTFEALSLAAQHPETPGRLTELLQPAGFETLAGIEIAKRAAALTVAPPRPVSPAAKQAAQQAAEQKLANEERAAERARQRAEEDVRKAERERDRARLAGSAARRDLERATAALGKAEEALAAARQKLPD